MDSVDVDVLVIGGGGAGAQAALAAAEQGAFVAILEKGVFGRSGCTVMGAYSCCAAFGHADPRDNPGVHFADTMRAGRGINDPGLVELFTREAPERVQQLFDLGVPFVRAGDGFAQAPLDGHTYPRACFISYFHTGRSMLRGLGRVVRATSQIHVYSDILVIDLISHDGRVWGALAYDLVRARHVLFRARATIIATGGGSRVYARSTVSADNTGDGLALAIRAGAALRDMEFVQFYPTVTLYPRLVGWDPTAPATLRLQAESRIYNARGEDFIDDLLPDWRFKGTRDFMARTIYSEIMRGGAPSPHGGVFIDVSHLPEEVIERELGVDGFYDNLRLAGIDLKKGPIETTVAAHYFMGGIRIDGDGWTGVDGLYAAGEATAGFHGANRLAGNALSEILVSGYRAGRAAALAAMNGGERAFPIDQVTGPQESLRNLIIGSQKDATGAELKQALQTIMWEKAGVVREADALAQAQREIEELALTATHGLRTGPEVPYNMQLVDAVEARRMITVGQAIVLSALTRQESRGAHFRSDFPREDSSWRVNLDVRQTSGGDDDWGRDLAISSCPIANADQYPEVDDVDPD
ncbi:MAG: L-aspartate oxidase [Ignavibacteriales bacterium]